jgi:hypothetical protein
MTERPKLTKAGQANLEAYRKAKESPYGWGQPIERICPPSGPRVMGVGRDPNNPKFYDVAFSAPLTDDQLRDLHEYLRGFSPVQRKSPASEGG